MRNIRMMIFLRFFLLCTQLQAQDAERVPAVMVYEVQVAESEKSDIAPIAFYQLPGLQKHFYCTRNNLLYMEIEKGQVAQFEAYMNHHNCICLPKLNCTIQRIQDQCGAEFKD
jgi:hypothetical protein